MPADEWFRRYPNGGTVYARAQARDVTARMAVPPTRPNGGGTVFRDTSGGETGTAGDPSKK
jgi:hypothetical protein